MDTAEGCRVAHGQSYPGGMPARVAAAAAAAAAVDVTYVHATQHTRRAHAPHASGLS